MNIDRSPGADHWTTTAIGAAAAAAVAQQSSSRSGRHYSSRHFKCSTAVSVVLMARLHRWLQQQLLQPCSVYVADLTM